MSKRSRLCEFPENVRKAIYLRDKGCIFCRAGFFGGGGAYQVAHYVARSQGGLGVEQNGAIVCTLHHVELDNGMDTENMRAFYKRYMQEQYPGWNEKDLVYDKWEGLHGRTDDIV